MLVLRQHVHKMRDMLDGGCNIPVSAILLMQRKGGQWGSQGSTELVVFVTVESDTSSALLCPQVYHVLRDGVCDGHRNYQGPGGR